MRKSGWRRIETDQYLESHGVRAVRGSSTLDHLVDAIVDDSAWCDDAFESLEQRGNLGRNPAEFRRWDDSALLSARERLLQRLEDDEARLGLYLIQACLVLSKSSFAAKPSPQSCLPNDFDDLAAYAPGDWSDFLLEAADAHRRACEGVQVTDPAGLPVVPGYADMSLLVQSGVHSIFRGTWEVAGIDTVIKAIPGKMTPELIGRFHREATILERLDHPTVASILEHGTCVLNGVNSPFLSTVRVNGEKLKHYLGRNPAVRDRLTLFVRLCRSIQYLHDEGVIHRDLHPGNVLVTPKGEPRVIDFGLSISSRELAGHARLSDPAQPLGHPDFRAPESSGTGDQRASPATDLYSLGALLHYLFVRTGPKSNTNGSSPSLRDLGRVAPSGIAPIVSKALRTQPGARYASAGELADEVEAVLEGRSPRARRGYARYRTRSWLRRHAVLLSCLCLALLLWHRDRGLLRDRERQAEGLMKFATTQFELFGAAAPVLEGLSHQVTSTPGIDALLDASQRAIHLALEYAGNDLGALRLRADALDQEAVWSTRLGRVARAQTALESARELRSQAATAGGRDAQDLALLSLNIIRIGDCQKAAGDPAAALRNYERAFGIDREIAERHPSRDALDNLVWSYARLADAYFDVDRAAAVDSCTRGLEVVRSLCAHAPDDPRSRHARCAVHLEVIRCLPRYDAAKAPFIEQALADARWLVAHYPETLEFQTVLLGALNAAGRAVDPVAHHAEAVARAEEYAEAASALVERAPTQSAFVEKAASAWILLGQTLRNADAAAPSVGAALHEARRYATLANELEPHSYRCSNLVPRAELALMYWHLARDDDDAARLHGRRVLAWTAQLHGQYGPTVESVVRESAVLSEGPPGVRDLDRAVRAAEQATALSNGNRSSAFYELSDALERRGDEKGAAEARARGAALDAERARESARIPRKPTSD